MLSIIIIVVKMSVTPYPQVVCFSRQDLYTAPLELEASVDYRINNPYKRIAENPRCAQIIQQIIDSVSKSMGCLRWFCRRDESFVAQEVKLLAIRLGVNIFDLASEDSACNLTLLKTGFSVYLSVTVAMLDGHLVSRRMLGISSNEQKEAFLQGLYGACLKMYLSKFIDETPVRSLSPKLIIELIDQLTIALSIRFYDRTRQVITRDAIQKELLIAFCKPDYLSHLVSFCHEVTLHPVELKKEFCLRVSDEIPKVEERLISCDYSSKRELRAERRVGFIVSLADLAIRVFDRESIEHLVGRLNAILSP